jgi:hypothetical protein
MITKISIGIIVIAEVSLTTGQLAIAVPEENSIERLPSQDDLPLCDGSVQDCVMYDGTVCQGEATTNNVLFRSTRGNRRE